ncbi:monovalent cation/H+ antiporter subunit D family protein [Actinoallomurus acaciae]|uniref:Monovalent cation/H+ antiporter subunit D family protein n=1 Tax=Actinoallomurus acaciae TaxID=502577 RepID=A0ABV5YW38_9ACTN
MNGSVLPLLVAAPLLAAGLCVAVPDRRLHRAAGMAVNAGVLLAGGLLLAAGSAGAVVTQRVGEWPPGIAIVFASDAFSALLLSVSALLMLAGLALARVTGEDAHPLFTPLALALSAGVYGALLTADLFDLFVFVEVMLVPSYALLTASGERGRITAGRIYVTVSLLASTLFLAGAGFMYGVTGTVNLGELGGTARYSPAAALAGGIVLLAMAAKAAVVPLHGWLPRTYPDASPAVAVIFSGLLTKVGLYVIIRVYAVVFGGMDHYRWVIMTAALLTMVIGVLGAVGEQSMRGILSFHMVSQIGYILLGLALFTLPGLTAAIFYMVQYILVKAALLACAGGVETTYGTGRLDRLDELARRNPLPAGVFMVAALSLAGLPPLSGFVAKLSLIRAAADRSDHVAVAVATAVSLFTLLSMIKIWAGAYWGEIASGTRSGGHRHARIRWTLTAPALLLAAPSVALGIWAQPLLHVAGTAAKGLTDTSAYVRAVTR